MSDLLSLGQLYDTDKVSHGYLPHYQSRFDAIRESSITLLEIGVMKGASLRMWRDFFSQGSIYGIDIVPAVMFTEDRIKTFSGAQQDATFLGSVAAETGPLDVVIDDGSHSVNHHLISFEILWPHLKFGGWYCIEDCFSMFYAMWATADGQARPGVDDPAEYDAPTIIDRLYQQRKAIFTGESPYAEIHIVTGGIYDGMILIQKEPNYAPNP